jgi:hypothetical protein
MCPSSLSADTHSSRRNVVAKMKTGSRKSLPFKMFQRKGRKKAAERKERGKFIFRRKKSFFCSDGTIN